MAGKKELKKATKSWRFMPLRDDAFHPLTHVDVRQMIMRMEEADRVIEEKGTMALPDGQKVRMPLNRPMDEWVSQQMEKHAKDAHKEIDAAVRDRLNVKPGATLTPGNIRRYTELYESEMKKRKKRP